MTETNEVALEEQQQAINVLSPPLAVGAEVENVHGRFGWVRKGLVCQHLVLFFRRCRPDERVEMSKHCRGAVAVGLGSGPAPADHSRSQA